MVATHREYDDHELIALCRDPEAGLTAIIAVHGLRRIGPMQEKHLTRESHLRSLSCTHQKI
jgi:hypothetical protein